MSITPEAKSRKQVFINYYTSDDYDQGLDLLPGLVRQAERSAIDNIEPRIDERLAVRKIIFDFIKEKNRKMYGGSAVNFLLKEKSPEDAIYDDYTQKDIEFYSPVPVVDVVDLCNILHSKGYKHIQGSSAKHEGTFNIYVNYMLYCDVSFATTSIYNGIKTITVDGIKCVDPHFIFIDHLRMYTSPLTAHNIWEKNFKRSYKLLKHYPLELFDPKINLPNGSDEMKKIWDNVKKVFLTREDIRECTLLGGFDAYNFYIKKASDISSHSELSRIKGRSENVRNSFSKYECNTPFMELYSVNYQSTAIELFSYLKTIVPDKNALTFEENFPLFMFIGYSLTIKYQDRHLIKIYDADGSCVPYVKLKIGFKYVSYHYTLMTFLMHKFKAHLDKDKDLYRSYGAAVSNLINGRNQFLENNRLLIINDTIFSEFRINCIGSTIDVLRLDKLKMAERIAKGQYGHKFKYEPSVFFTKHGEDSQKNFDPMRYNKFPNTSGNIIANPKNSRFALDENLDLIIAVPKEQAEIASEAELSIETESDIDSDPNKMTLSESGNQIKSSESESEIEISSITESDEEDEKINI